MPVIRIKMNEDKEFYFLLLHDDETLLLRSEMYSTKSNCIHGIESVKENFDDEARYERMMAENGQFYFNLKASNGEIIGTSTMYDDSTVMDRAIEIIKTESTDIEWIDFEEELEEL